MTDVYIILLIPLDISRDNSEMESIINQKK